MIEGKDQVKPQGAVSELPASLPEPSRRAIALLDQADNLVNPGVKYERGKYQSKYPPFFLEIISKISGRWDMEGGKGAQAEEAPPEDPELKVVSEQILGNPEFFLPSESEEKEYDIPKIYRFLHDRAEKAGEVKIISEPTSRK